MQGSDPRRQIGVMLSEPHHEQGTMGKIICMRLDLELNVEEMMGSMGNASCGRRRRVGIMVGLRGYY
jgi:hypothetical protein